MTNDINIAPIPTDDYTDTLFVYIGRGETSDGRGGGKIIAIDLLKRCETLAYAEQQSSFFIMKDRELPRAVGFVYTIKAKIDETGRITNIRGSHSIDGNQDKHGINKAWLAHWQAQERAQKVADKVRKIEKKYDRDELRAQLSTLKRDYMATDKIGRLALEVVVLDILRSG